MMVNVLYWRLFHLKVANIFQLGLYGQVATVLRKESAEMNYMVAVLLNFGMNQKMVSVLWCWEWCYDLNTETPGVY